MFIPNFVKTRLFKTVNKKSDGDLFYTNVLAPHWDFSWNLDVSLSNLAESMNFRSLIKLSFKKHFWGQWQSVSFRSKWELIFTWVASMTITFRNFSKIWIFQHQSHNLRCWFGSMEVAIQIVLKRSTLYNNCFNLHRFF